MKLYNRQEFLALPAGVVFAKYEPNCFDEWKIKGESLTNDFHYQPFLDLGAEDQELWEAYEELDKTGSAFTLGTEMVCLKLFAVLEAEEVRGLVLRLASTLLEGYGTSS